MQNVPLTESTIVFNVFVSGKDVTIADELGILKRRRITSACT
jgi:hypothetical protein